MKKRVIGLVMLMILLSVVCACTGIVPVLEEQRDENNLEDGVVASEEMFSENEDIENRPEDKSDAEGTNETEINVVAEPEEIVSTGLSEAELVTIVEVACGKTLEEYNYVYVDMNKDGAYELMATCKEDYVHQIWFCSADGTVCKMINENTWGFMECMLKVTDTETYALVTTQFLPDAGPYEEYIIWGMKDADVVTVMQGIGYASILENGSMIVEHSTYTAYWDVQWGSYSGRSWIVYYKEYDKETNQFIDVKVNQITKEEFEKYSNSGEIINDIETKVQEWEPYKTEYSFYKTSNEKMYIQCNLYDAIGNITFTYYIVDCEGDRLSEIPEDEEISLGDLSELIN